MANFLMALKLGAERSLEIPPASASKILHGSSGARWHRQINSASAHVSYTVPKRIRVRIVNFESAIPPLTPVRLWSSSLCDVCLCYVSVVFYSGTVKLGPCCYTQHLVRECRNG